MRRKKLLLVLLPLAIIFAWGCSRDDSPVAPEVAAPPLAVDQDHLNTLGVETLIDVVPAPGDSIILETKADTTATEEPTRILRVTWGKVKDKYARAYGGED